MISTGAVFREIREEDSELGRKVKELIDNGILVPDEIVNDIVAKRLEKKDCNEGFVLDGYPRHLGQAKFLDEHKPITKCVFLDISDAACIKRMSARRVCHKCKAGYNMLYAKPKKEGICDECGGKLVQRDDDKPEAIKVRLEKYHKDTEPLIEFYDNEGVLLIVNGDQQIDKVFEEIMEGLKK